MLEDKYPNQRTRAERKHNNWRKAIRKKKISDSYGCFIGDDWHWYHELHQYSKNKIHCSCPMCRAKTNNTGRKGSLSAKYNPKISEIRRNEKLDYQEEDCSMDE